MSLEVFKPLECLELVFEWGPLHSLSSTQLRQEFDFVTEVTKTVNSSSKRYMQELVFQLVLKFTNQVKRVDHH